MHFLFIQQARRGVYHVLTSTLVAGWMSSPMSWSPDSQWLSYTVTTSTKEQKLQPGWLFATSSDQPETRARADLADRMATDPPQVYQIWTSHQDGRTSLLIEESRWPLTTASWSPLGRSVAFGRFVPQSIEPDQAGQRGRFEVVVQQGLDRRGVVWKSAEFELDSRTRASFEQLVCSWSPDGLYLAIPRPGRHPTITIVRTDSKKQLHMLDHAILPAWSPDGSKCAFVRCEGDSYNLEVVERRGDTVGTARKIVMTGPITAAPFWSSDGRSILAVIERPTARSPDLELVRCVLDPDTALVTRLLNLAPEPVRRSALVRGVAIDFDREAERCFFSVDLVGRDSDLVWGIPRDHETHKRYNPLDVSQRIGAVAVSPDGRNVAVRFGMPGALSPPALTDYESEQTSLIVPDEPARQEWISVLTRTARRLLQAALPPAAVDGRAALRPTLLPLPGEIAALDVVNARLIRIARLGSSICSNPADRRSAAELRAVDSIEIEARLFFNYLRGDFTAATADLDALDPCVSALAHRDSLLSVRAQILLSEGKRTEARDVIGYLISTAGAHTRRIEETPVGPVVTMDVTPSQAWATYLSTRAARPSESAPQPVHDRAREFAVPRLQDPFDVLEFRGFERGEAAFPFAPAVRPGEGPGGANAAGRNAGAPLPPARREPRS
jgi:hypothetical protein